MNEIFQLIGCISMSSTKYGFYLPIFVSEHHKGVFIQQTDFSSQIIDRFDLIDDDLKNMSDIGDRREVSVGDAPLYVFRSNAGFEVGELDHLETHIQLFLSQSYSSSIDLQYAELYGSSVEKREARNRIIEFANQRLDFHAETQFFVDSLFLGSLWQNVLAGLKTRGSQEELSAIHSLVLKNGSLEIPDIFPESIWMKIEPLLNIDRDELKRKVYEELPNEVTIRQSNLFSENADLELEPPDEQMLAEALAVLRGAGRQEERIAIILRYLLENREVGKFLMSSHRDRGKMARQAIQLIDDNFWGCQGQKQQEIFVAKFVRPLFTMTFNFNRGELLYYLAKHLGHHKNIAAAIRDKMQQSRAYNVYQLRDVIEEILVKAAREGAPASH